MDRSLVVVMKMELRNTFLTAQSIQELDELEAAAMQALQELYEERSEKLVTGGVGWTLSTQR